MKKKVVYNIVSKGFFILLAIFAYYVMTLDNAGNRAKAGDESHFVNLKNNMEVSNKFEACKADVYAECDFDAVENFMKLHVLQFGNKVTYNNVEFEELGKTTVTMDFLKEAGDFEVKADDWYYHRGVGANVDMMRVKFDVTIDKDSNIDMSEYKEYIVDKKDNTYSIDMILYYETKIKDELSSVIIWRDLPFSKMNDTL